jgi:hypothetical protein
MLAAESGILDCIEEPRILKRRSLDWLAASVWLGKPRRSGFLRERGGSWNPEGLAAL